MNKKIKGFAKSNIVNLEKTESEEDKYEKYGCKYLNEAVCREMLEEDGFDMEEVEENHFGNY